MLAGGWGRAVAVRVRRRRVRRILGLGAARGGRAVWCEELYRRQVVCFAR